MPKCLVLVLLLLLGFACVAQTTTGTGQPSRIDKCQYDWPKEEVDWIIPDNERAAYYALTTDADREEFITIFWMRRDPSPDSYNNKLAMNTTGEFSMPMNTSRRKM